MFNTEAKRDLVDILNEYGTDKLNSLTKYPSIQTYHEIDRGCLKENLTDYEGFENEEVYITEKVDGTNGRIVVLNGDYIIGSREELLYRKGDIFGNPSQNILDIMKPWAEDLATQLPMDNKLRVFYGEVYGSNINGAKQYTKHRNSNVRFFDCVVFDSFEEIIIKPIDHISIWREHGRQPFVSVSEFADIMQSFGYDNNVVPFIMVEYGDNLPTERSETYEWLKQFEVTHACIDEDTFKGRAEGVVVRNADRSMIRKIRFEDYEKTIRKQGRL